MGIDVRPVTAERWDDLLTLFGERGAYSGCWCMWFRRTKGAWSDNRAMFQGLVDDGRVPGLLAYQDGQPVGWVSLAPRPEYGRIVGPPSDHEPGPAASPVWSVVCFYIDGRQRGGGIATALLDAAVEHARSQGAQVLEAYPVEPEGRTRSSDAYTGLRSMFERAGFQEVGRFERWRQVPSIAEEDGKPLRRPPGRPVMQLRLADSSKPRRQPVAGALASGTPRRVSSAPKPSRSSTPT